MLIADPWAIKKAVGNDRVEERFSRLAERVKEGREGARNNENDCLRPHAD